MVDYESAKKRGREEERKSDKLPSCSTEQMLLFTNSRSPYGVPVL